MNSIKNKKVLVTGADGFIGSHVVEELVHNGAEVDAMVYYNSWNSHGWLGDIPKEIFSKIKIVRADVRDSGHMNQLIPNFDYVLHLASLIAIPYSYDAPLSYVETNVIGTTNILNAAKNSKKLIRLIHTSTSEVYGTAQTVPITEQHPLVGQSPYSASKIAADKMAESFARSFNMPIVTARPFNTYGPRQTARAIIPTIISQALKGSTIQLGDLTPTRDFNFAKDTARGFLKLMSAPGIEGETFNIGSGREISIKDLVQLIEKILDKKIEVKQDPNRIRPEKSEVFRLLACNKKTESKTGYKPEVTLEEGLKSTIDWIRNNLGYFSDEYAK